MNENGVLFGWCATNQMIIGDTLFPYGNMHKVSWMSPDKKFESQINHFAINRKWRISFLDTRSKSGADINSDHYLMVVKLRMKLRKLVDRFNQLTKEYIIRLKIKKVKEKFQLKL